QIEDGARTSELVDGVVAIENRFALFQRTGDPGPQGARSHRRARGIDDVPERSARLEHLEIGERRGIELEKIAFIVDAQRSDVIERLFVACGRVAQRRTRRTDADIAGFETEP